MKHTLLIPSGALVAAIAICGCQRTSTASIPAHEQTHSKHKSAGDAHAGHAPSFSKLVVNIDKEPQAGSDSTLRMSIQGSGGAVVQDFEVVHDRRAHLIVVTQGLDQFAHLHPEVSANGSMTVNHTFPVGGHYLLFLDYKPVGRPQATAFAELHVGGPVKTPPELRPNVPGTIEQDDLKAEVEMSTSDGGAKRLRFKLSDRMGQPLSNLEPYMGAMGHLVVISADGKDYVHAHMEGAEADKGVVTFEAHFKNPGLYKGWGQFQQNGRIRVVPFVIRNE